MNRALKIRLFVLFGLLVLGVVATCAVLLYPNGVLVSLLRLTHLETGKPPKFGGFHLSFMALCVLLIAVVIVMCRKISRERLDSIIFALGIVFFVLELYKQLYYHTVLGNGHYNFAILPFQLCSYVLYLYLLLPLLPDCRAKNALYGFAAIYQTLGGGIVLAFPLFYKELALSVHTMVWHVLMVTGGLLILFCRGYGKRYLPELLPPLGIFIGVFVFGMVLNVVLYPCTEHSAGALNLFYLSPYGVTNNFLIGDVRKAFGWFSAVLTYVSLITLLGSNVIWLIARGASMLGAKGKQVKGGGDQNG